MTFLLVSCSETNRPSGYMPGFNFNDSISQKLKYAEVNFAIPSPNQLLILFRHCHLSFNEKLLISPGKLEKTANISAKKAIALGMLGTDLGYMNLYDQKDLATKHIHEIKHLMNELKIERTIDKSLIKKIEANFGKNDSIYYYLSLIFKGNDEYLKDNDRRDICALIIAGGWIESFYYLTQVYAITKSEEIFKLIVNQNEVLDNIIRQLSPFYEKSLEFATLIDALVNMAYEYDVVDKTSSQPSIRTDTLNHFTYIDNHTKNILSGSKLEHLMQFTSELRNKYVI